MAKCIVFLLLLLLLSWLVTPNSSNATEVEAAQLETLYLLALAPYPDPAALQVFKPGWAGGPGVIPAVRLAVDLINERSDILANYTLAVIERDSGCNNLNIKGLVAYTEELFIRKHKIVGVVGPACSDIAVQTGLLGHPSRAAMVQATIANSHVLTDRSKFPCTFMTLSSGRGLSVVLKELIRVNGWHRIGVLYDGLSIYYQSIVNSLGDVLKADDMSSIIKTSIPTYHTSFPLQEMKDTHLRIFLLLLDTSLARKIMCLVYQERNRFTFPKYQWVFTDIMVTAFSTNTHFLYNGRNYNCSAQELMSAAEGSILLRFKLTTNRPEAPTVSGLNYSEYEELYRRKVEEHERELNRTIPSNPYANAYHDAVWAMALALNASILSLSKNGTSLSDYRPGRKDIANVISQQFTTSVQFHGVSGDISFDASTGHPCTFVSLFQVHNHTEVSIQVLTPNTTCSAKVTVITNGTFISDSFETRHAYVAVVTFVVFVSITILLLTSTVALHIINILCSKQPSIKASSPALNHLIFLGVYLLILVMINLLVLGFSTPSHTVSNVFCNATLGLNHLGMSLILSTICVKTWRIYQIFVHSWKPADHLHSRVLIAVALFVVLPVIIYCLIRCTVDPLKVNHREEFHDNDGNPYIEGTDTCQPEWYDILTLRLYEALMLVFALYLSVLTRHVRLKNFQSTRSISSLTFSFILIATVTAPLNLVAVWMQWALDVVYIIEYTKLSGLLLMCLTFGLFPPVIPILRRTRHTKKKTHT